MADWTETHRPSTLAEVRGNDKARDALRAWAESWPSDGRAVILAGSPGVGKTSAAHALASEMGWEAVEVNASDSRKRDDIERLVGRASTNQGIDGALQRAKKRLGAGEVESGSEDVTRQLLVVDEADSFHRPDRGGARALSEIVRETEQPVVLIVNDAYEMPDGLRRSLETIEFRDVPARSIVPVLRDVCRKEGVEYEDAALSAIAETNSGDLRGAINDLQAIAEATDRLTADDVVTGERDRTRGIFEFLDDVLKEEDAEGALRSAYDADETPDDLISWIEDNLPKDYEGAELARAYGFLANADKWLGRVRATQNYSYWRYATDNMAAGVAAARGGPKGGWTRYGPPSYWRKLGASRANREKRDYVARKVATRSGTSTATARQSIVPYLAAMTHHCSNRELTVAMAAAYDLDEEHVAFVTGSGKDTNKVQDVVADAERLREEAAVEASGGAFEGGQKTAFGGGQWSDGEGGGGDEGEDEADAADGDDGEDRADSAEADDDQASFADFS